MFCNLTILQLLKDKTPLCPLCLHNYLHLYKTASVNYRVRTEVQPDSERMCLTVPTCWAAGKCSTPHKALPMRARVGTADTKIRTIKGMVRVF